MPWGKHLGDPISEIESSYLCWVIDNADHLAPDLKTAITAELRSRFGSPPPPPPRSAVSPWRTPCPDPTLASDIVAAGLRTLAKKHHPDTGGDTTTMQRLNAAAEWLRRTVPQ
jgi:hypothetical protein